MGGLPISSHMELRGTKVVRVKTKHSKHRHYGKEDGVILGDIKEIEQKHADWLPLIQGYQGGGPGGGDATPDPLQYTIPDGLLMAFQEISDIRTIRAMQSKDGRPGTSKLYIDKLEALEGAASKTVTHDDDDGDEIEVEEE